MYRVYAIVILSVLLCLATGAGAYLYKKWKNEKHEKESVIKLNGNTVKEVTYYKNLNHNLVAKNESIELENKTIKQLHKEGQLAILDEFKGLKRNYRNLENLIQAQVQVKDKINFHLTDSASTKKFEFKSDDLSFKGISKNDSVNVDYQVNVPVSIVVFWKRKWFLGKKHFEVQATSSNKKAILTGLESIQVRKR